MGSKIVIRHLEVRYIDLENMGNGKKRVEHFREFHSGIKKIHLYFLRKDPYLVSCSLFSTEYEESRLFYCSYNNI